MASRDGTVTTGILDVNTYYWCNWQLVSQDPSTNKSVINYQYGVNCNYNYYDNALRIDWVSINGATVKGSETYSYLNKGNHQLGSGSMTIDHNPDGKKIFNINLGGWVIGEGSTSGSKDFELPRINRYAKTNSVSGDNIENSFSVNYTKYVNTYTYKLRITIPNVKTLETIDYNTSDAAFTLSKASIEEIYDYFPDTNSFELGFAVETYNNGTKVSDGNEVKKQCSKTDRIIRVKISDEWKRATPYVRVNGEWKKAIPYTRINNEWKRGR